MNAAHRPPGLLLAGAIGVSVVALQVPILSFALWFIDASAEVELVKSGGWTVTTDGRVNAFVSHIWGDDRPKGFESLAWMAFNEAPDTGQADANKKLQKTRVRSGYVPSTLAFNLRKELRKEWLTVAARAEIGFQIADTEPVAPADPTWMQPRSVYLDLSGLWGSVRAGRDRPSDIQRPGAPIGSTPAHRASRNASRRRPGENRRDLPAGSNPRAAKDGSRQRRARQSS